MKFKTSQQGGTTVIAIEGNLMGGPDASTLNDKLVELIDAKKKHVVIDLGGVNVINSSGLGMLIKGASTMKGAGGGLAIANASDKILDLIRITKLTGVLQTYNTVADAAASFKK
ncbi:STAS domain-containing protein [Sphingobacteriales bacterium CHB3]|nr:STAS domain-containing protein [Sphingobacteriales bacterium CHB3]